MLRGGEIGLIPNLTQGVAGAALHITMIAVTGAANGFQLKPDSGSAR